VAFSFTTLLSPLAGAEGKGQIQPSGTADDSNHQPSIAHTSPTDGQPEPSEARWNDAVPITRRSLRRRLVTPNSSLSNGSSSKVASPARKSPIRQKYRRRTKISKIRAPSWITISSEDSPESLAQEGDSQDDSPTNSPRAYPEASEDSVSPPGRGASTPAKRRLGDRQSSDMEEDSICGINAPAENPFPDTMTSTSTQRMNTEPSLKRRGLSSYTRTVPTMPSPQPMGPLSLTAEKQSRTHLRVSLAGGLISYSKLKLHTCMTISEFFDVIVRCSRCEGGEYVTTIMVTFDWMQDADIEKTLFVQKDNIDSFDIFLGDDCGGTLLGTGGGQTYCWS